MPEPVKLDAMSELMALSSFANTKNIILMAVEAKGPFDESAFRSAVREASALFPTLTSSLRELREGGRFFLFRQYNPDLDLHVTVSDVTMSNGPEPSFHTLVEHLTPRLDRYWDLLHEPPLEIHVLHLEPQHVLLAFMFHHVAGDAAMSLRVISETLARYDAIVNQRPSEWASMPYVFSTSKKKGSRPGKAGLRHLASQLMRDLKYRRQRPVQPEGSGKANELTEWHVKRVLSVEETRDLFDQVSKGGIHVVDHLVASSNFVLDRWNETRNVPPGTITSVVTVNMRERFGGEDEKNYSSTIFFRSTPEERKDAPAFARAVAAARRKQLTRQMDLMVRRSIAMGAAFFTLFPFGIRRRAADFFMRRQRFSVAVGFLGVVWPDLREDGCFSEESLLQRAGEFEIIDVHGTGYKLSGNAQVNLYSYIYRKRLSLITAVSASLLTRKECEAFTDLLTRTILGSCDSA